MDNLKLILETLDTTLSQEIASYLSKHLIPCSTTGCRHMATDLEGYNCWYCHRAFCLAEHLQRVNLVDLYSDRFVQSMWYPPQDYMCETCIEYVNAEYRLYQDDQLLFMHNKWQQMTRRILGKHEPWEDHP